MIQERDQIDFIILHTARAIRKEELGVRNNYFHWEQTLKSETGIGVGNGMLANRDNNDVKNYKELLICVVESFVVRILNRINYCNNT